FVGYAVDDETGEPLANVLVSSSWSRTKIKTDARGFFQIYVPATSNKKAAPNLIFSKADYQSEHHINLELSSNGDWIYRVRLSRGRGEKIVDENQFRRRSAPPETVSEPQP